MNFPPRLSRRRSVAPITAGLIALLSVLAACHRSRPPGVCDPGGAVGLDSTKKPAPVAATAVADADWSTYGGNFSSQRYSELQQVNRENVATLVPVCLHRASIGAEGQQGTAIVEGDALFYPLPYNSVVAVDANSGRELWRFKPQMNANSIVTCCGPHSRGLAVDSEHVYLNTLDARVIALDRHTGNVVWQVQVADPTQGYSFTGAPLVADGKVIMGPSGGVFGIRGFVDAYDAHTGARVWRFNTIPSPEEGGWWGKWATQTAHGEDLHRDIAREKADSAQYADAWKTGGGPVWMTPSFDPTLGYIFFGVGNPAPVVDAAKRPGDNLYTASIVALDVKTGKVVWYQQVLPHDRWDYDPTNPVILFDLTTNGTTAHLLSQAGKTGFVYVLDRATGRHIMRSDPLVPHVNFLENPTTAGISVAPGGHGGSNWAPSAFSPRTELLYVLANHEPSMFKLAPAPKQQGAQWFGGEMVVDGSQKRYGRLNAVDPRSGKVRWMIEEPNLKNYSGGTLTTAGDVVFFGDTDGYFNAVDARDGKRLWRSYVSPTSIDAAPMTFSRGGRQYVAIATQSALVAFTLP